MHSNSTPDVKEDKLRINEIFFSLQGETSRVGLPSTFIRLTGCPLRCNWCDTTYAFQGGEWMSIPFILNKVAQFPTRIITVTGGEPLAQKACTTLLDELCSAGYNVSLETSGALDISTVNPRVSRIMDIKAPGSGEAERNHWPNINNLNAHDEVKLVIANRADYDWFKEIITCYRLTERCPVLMAPVQGQQSATELAEWILADGLLVRLQLQLHKILWGNSPGH